MTARMGKLTSLNPNFKSVLLSKDSSIFTVSHGLVEIDMIQRFSSQSIFQIYQEKENFFVCYTGSDLSVHIEDQIFKEGQAVKTHSGEKIVLCIEGQNDIRMEYIFSSELTQTQKSVYRTEEIENQTKFYEDLKNELTCGICQKMILECASVVPCLHKFCIEGLLLHFIRSQKCPECGLRCEDFRKDTFFNNIIEAYEEYGYKRGKYEKDKLERTIIFVKFEFGNGEVYEGEWKKFRKDGRGKFIFKNGDVYEGDWKNNQREGKGKIIYKNGNVYEGDWKNNLIEGKGKMTWTDGEFYKGNWKNNQREGYGKRKYISGNIYKGEWKDGQREGYGKMKYNSATIYEGEWKDNWKEGKGKITWTDGEFYEGDWKNNQREGRGKMKYKEGSVFEGDWVNNLREGKGKIIRRNGEVYEGNWKNDEREDTIKKFFNWVGERLMCFRIKE